MYLCVCHLCLGARRDQKGVAEPLELDSRELPGMGAGMSWSPLEKQLILLSSEPLPSSRNLDFWLFIL